MTASVGVQQVSGNQDLAWPQRPPLLLDGTRVTVRRLIALDEVAVRALHESLDERDRYRRFFTSGRSGIGTEIREMLSDDKLRLAFGAWRGDRLVGVVTYALDSEDPTLAEIALIVSRRIRAVGVATVLLERLAREAHRRGVRRLLAEVLVTNTDAQRMLAGMGLPCHWQMNAGVLEATLALEATPHFVDAVALRERAAESARFARVARSSPLRLRGAL